MSYDLLFGAQDTQERMDIGAMEEWFRKRIGWTVTPAHQALFDTPGGDCDMIVSLHGPEAYVYENMDEAGLDRHVSVSTNLGWGDVFDDRVWTLFETTFSQLCAEFELLVFDPQSEAPAFVPFSGPDVRENFKLMAEHVRKEYPFLFSSGEDVH